MKLIAGLIASTLAIECPNAAWEANSDDTACVPVGVAIQCDATEMVVTFDVDHLYVNVDEQHVDDTFSGASVGSCAEVTSMGGIYELRIPLDDCATEVAQGIDTLSFTNTIVGNDLALMVDGIITTEKLELDVQCDYASTFDISVGDIGIEAAGHALGDTADIGDVSIINN